MAEPVRVRRLTDHEGQKLQQIVRRGGTSSVRYRRAMMLLASVGGGTGSGRSGGSRPARGAGMCGADVSSDARFHQVVGMEGAAVGGG